MIDQIQTGRDSLSRRQGRQIQTMAAAAQRREALHAHVDDALRAIAYALPHVCCCVCGYAMRDIHWGAVHLRSSLCCNAMWHVQCEIGAARGQDPGAGCHSHRGVRVKLFVCATVRVSSFGVGAPVFARGVLTCTRDMTARLQIEKRRVEVAAEWKRLRGDVAALDVARRQFQAAVDSKVRPRS